MLDLPAGEYLWGDFQSVAQLAVALNAAFASLAGFLGSDIRRARQRIRAAIARHDKVPPAGDRAIGIRSASNLRLLAGGLEHTQRKFEERIDYLARPLCLAGMLLGIILLLYSCFAYRSSISAFSICLIIFSMLPFCAGVVYSIFVGVCVFCKMWRERILL